MSELSQHLNDDDGRWYTLGLALVKEGFERPRMVDDQLRARLKRVIDHMDAAAAKTGKQKR